MIADWAAKVRDARKFDYMRILLAVRYLEKKCVVLHLTPAHSAAAALPSCIVMLVETVLSSLKHAQTSARKCLDN